MSVRDGALKRKMCVVSQALVGGLLLLSVNLAPSWALSPTQEESDGRPNNE